MSQRPLNEHGGTATRVGVRLTREQHRTLRQVARRRGVTPSALLRELVGILDRIDLAELEGRSTGPPGSG